MTLECVVRADGTVWEGRVVKSLHPTLNMEALRALADWRFKPGTKDGKLLSRFASRSRCRFSLQDAETPYRGPAVDSPEVFIAVNGVTTPTVVREVKPNYAFTALRDQVQGLVQMKCVVLPDGTVGDVKLTQSVHPDLDDTAVRTLRQWTFTPGTKDGVAVPVQINVDMFFTIAPRK